MHLRRLQLAGFKTFADRTEIEFGDGLTAVVGPNGCGKSNVADALLWVMGEQNPRLLRGTDSRDVIFTGTDRRKPLGMAEVRLTIDNSDHSLPLDFAEVVVARRIYRSGESSYTLNGANCRLKDIVELFLDTGLGRGAYAFVTQNEVDAVLSARAEDRRELFEEAAGINKYRARKREALRKLEHAESNLTRVRDIVRELETQREPLREQSETAARYLLLTDRLQHIEVDLLVADAQKTDYELYAARRELELDREIVQRFDAELADLERKAEQARARLAEAEAELDTARLSQQGAMTSVERMESKREICRERGLSSEMTIAALDAEIRELVAREAAIGHEIADSEKQLVRLQSQSTDRSDDLVAARSGAADIERRLQEARRLSEDRHAAMRGLVERRAHQESALAAFEERLADSNARLADLLTESKEVEVQLREVVGRQAAAQKIHTDVGSRLVKLRDEVATCEGQLQTSREEHGRVSEELARHRSAVLGRESRLAALVELQQAGEGLFQGVRAVMGAARSGSLSGTYVPVADLLHVPEEYRTAIEVALGSAAQDVVCDTEEQAKAAIEHLKARRAGRATFLPLASLHPGIGLSDPPVRQIEGMVGVASDMVDAAEKYGPAIRLLLGRIAVAQDMDAALTASRRLQGWSRIVTIQGEVVTPGGAITGGYLAGKGAHLVGRKGEIDDLQQALPAEREALARLEADADAASHAIAALSARCTVLKDEIAQAQVDAASASSDATAAERDADRLSERQAALRGEKDTLAIQLGEMRQTRVGLEADVATGRAEDADVDGAIASSREEAEQLARQFEDARAALVDLEVKAARSTEQRRSGEHALSGQRSTLAQTTATRTAKQALREQSASLWAESDATLRELAEKLHDARKHQERCDAHFVKWRDKRQELLNASYEASAAIKEITRQRSETLQETHAAELQIARLEVRVSQTAQRLNDEYGMSLQEALDRPDPGEMERDTVNEVARIRREIRQMGQVNTGAVDEYERLTERHEFLSAQEADLANARASLLTTISEIDESTRGVFMETFDAVAGKFGSLFERLFGGGTTRLVLTRPDDLLETGIEVLAQPPGKKPQHLSLLSGGERALTATALLFSFLAVRPSPFVVLDEIDAPLDGPNVEKFVELVRDFSQRSQFLVITHNPTTMEAAPRWYGVTMQEPGVSRVLSYKVPEEAIPADGDAEKA